MPFADEFHEVFVLLALLAIFWIVFTVLILVLTGVDAAVTFTLVSFVFIKAVVLAASGLVILQVLRHKLTSSVAFLTPFHQMSGQLLIYVQLIIQLELKPT